MRKANFIIVLGLFLSFKGNAQMSEECRQKIDSMSNVLLIFVVKNDGLSAKSVLDEIVPFEKNNKGSIYNRLREQCGLYENAKDYFKKSDSNFINLQIDDTAVFKLPIDKNEFRGIRIITNPEQYNNGYYVFSKPIFSANFDFAILKISYFFGESFLWSKHYIYKIEKDSIKEMKTFCHLTG